MARTRPFGGSGDLDRVIQIQRQRDTQVKDAYGESVPTPGQVDDGWLTLRTCYSTFHSLGGDEKFTANQRLAESDGRFEIRYPLDVLGTEQFPGTRDTILYESRRYDIVSISEVGRKERLEFVARLRAGEAA